MKAVAKAVQVAPVDAEKQLKRFVDNVEPKHRKLIRSVEGGSGS